MIFAMRLSRTRSDHGFPLLPVKSETNLVSVDGDMPVLEGSQAIAVVLLRVIVIPHADQGGFEEMHHRGQHFLPRQPAQSHVLAHFLPDGGKRVREGNNMLVLSAFPHLAEACVIAVLLAALRVPARGRDVAVGKRANPNVCPGRRDHQGLDPFQQVKLGELRPVGPDVRESFSCLLAPYARTGIGNISQARRLGGILGIDNCLRANRRIE